MSPETPERCNPPRLALHSFSMVWNYRLDPSYDVFAFIAEAAALGFSGVNINLNGPGYRHLSGTDLDHMTAVRAALDAAGLDLEIDTSGTAPAHLRELLAVAMALGARALRTYTRHGGSPEERIEQTLADLRAALPLVEAAGIPLLIENHEEFTGPELAALVGSLDHPLVGVLFDYGNSMMLLEDPWAALEALAPHIRAVHIKDHVVVPAVASAAGAARILGVPMGQGNLPIRAMTERILSLGLRRLVFENVWAYSAPLARRAGEGRGILGKSCFAYRFPPYDPAVVLPDVEDLAARDPARLCALERQALEEGLAWLRGTFREAGFMA